MKEAPQPKPKTLSDHRKALREYIKTKEERSGDDISTRVGRDKRKGYVTSFFPIISLRRILSNYAEGKGVAYKIMHPTLPYKSSRPVLFPKARNFFGAKRKDWKSTASKRGIISRVRNIGKAQYLTRIIDNIEKRKKEGEKNIDTAFYVEVYEQIMYKRTRNINDTYHKLLSEIFNSLDKEDQDKIIGSEQFLHVDLLAAKAKRDFLNWSAENTNPNDYVRGEDYSFKNLEQYTGWLDRKVNFEPIRKHLKSTQQFVEKIDKAKEKFEVSTQSIKLPIVPKLFDKAMKMRLTSNAKYFEKYVIKGKSMNNNAQSIIGKNDKPLENGWYQFVIMAEVTNGIPEIRYYPCGEKQDGLALYEQINVIRNDPPSARTGEKRIKDDKEIKIGKNDEYTVTEPRPSPKNPDIPEMRYDKFSAHSQLAGGKAVLSGGAFMVVDGKVEIIEDSSGHYASEKGSGNEYEPIQVAYQAFNCFDILSKNCAFERWDPYKGIDKLFKKTAGALKYPLFPPPILEENKQNPELYLAPGVTEMRATPPGMLTPAQALWKKSKAKSMGTENKITPETTVKKKGIKNN